MFLRESNRFKDGKNHRYYSVVENRRVRRGRHVQQTLLYLGEINDTQRASWVKTIDAVQGRQECQIALFPEDRAVPPEIDCAVQVQLGKIELSRPRQWGGCWLACELWDKLELTAFWEDRLGQSRKGTRWHEVLQVLVVYRLLDPGSEWRLHRYWYEHSAMADLLGRDFRLAAKNTLYRCHDHLVKHKQALFTHLRSRWEDLFEAKFDVLLYDLTSTYFESDPPFEGLRQFGYSRDKRSDCVQVVIALVVTPEGLPLSYEVMPGNTSDKTTLKDFLGKIEAQYGRAQRVWVMDRGIPTEEVLSEMRAAESPVYYLVGTPKGRLSKYEQELSGKPWQKVKEDVEVKLLPQDNEVYVYAQSKNRIHKERSMRLRRLRRLLKRLKQIRSQKSITRDSLLLKLGSEKKDAGRAYGLLDIHLPTDDRINEQTFHWKINLKKYRQAHRREGRYLLRTNLTDEDPKKLWKLYIVLTEVEQAFKNLKGDLSVRPIYHQLDRRIEAHIFISFLAYCLHVTLSRLCAQSAAGLTSRSVMEQLKTIQMLDVKIPTTDSRTIKMKRYTKPNKTQQLILAQLKLSLPQQPPPEVSAPNKPCGEDL